MKKILLIIILIISNIYSQTINKNYTIATWPNFRKAAISYTFDDLTSGQLSTAVPMFNEFGYQLTLFVVTDWSPDWDGLKKASLKGHEIASHTITHPSFGELTDSLQNYELEESQLVINTNIPNKKCITMAYPYCVTGDPNLVNIYYIGARICSGLIEQSTPADFMAISSILCGSLSSMKTSKAFNEKSEEAAETKGWAVYLLHGIDEDGGYSPISSDSLRASLEYLNNAGNKFWVTSFGNVTKYIKERDAVSIHEKLKRNSKIIVKVTDNLDNSIFDIPVTIRRILPNGWTNVKIKQNGKNIDSKIIDDTIQFDVIPDNGKIVIRNITAKLYTK